MDRSPFPTSELDTVELPNRPSSRCCYSVKGMKRCPNAAQYVVTLAYCICGYYHPAMPEVDMCDDPAPDDGCTYVCNDHTLSMRTGFPQDWPNMREVRSLASVPAG